MASYSKILSNDIKCNENDKASAIINKLTNINAASTNLQITCDGVPWIVGNCQNIPRICANCTSLCNDKATNSINIGQYPLVCGYSTACFKFMFVRLNTTEIQVASNFISIEPIATTTSSVVVTIALSGPASVACSAYLDLIDPINPYSISNRNTTNTINTTTIVITGYYYFYIFYPQYLIIIISLMPSSRYRILCSIMSTEGSSLTTSDALYVDTICCNILNAKLSTTFLVKSPVTYQDFVVLTFSSQPLFQLALTLSIVDSSGTVIAGNSIFFIITNTHYFNLHKIIKVIFHILV